RAAVADDRVVRPPMLLEVQRAPEGTWHGVRVGVGGGVGPELDVVFEKRFGFSLIEVWGMTETGRIFGDCYDPRQTSTRAFGRPFGEFEARVVDERDREVPRGREGELVVRCAGPDPRRGFFSGYLKN